MRRLAFALSLLAAPAGAQELCTGPMPTDLPACLPGAWAGESDAAERFEAILSTLPENVRANVGGDLGRYLFMAIYDDGFYATWPISGGAEVAIFNDHGEATDLTFDLVTTPATGWMWAGESGALGFCAVPGTGVGTTTATGSSFGGTSAFTVDSRAAAAGVPPPSMSYLCDGDLLIVTVDLPAPIGAVTYTLRRVARSAMPREFGDLYDRRFGG